MDKKEKLILSIMKSAEADGEPISREEAEEMAEMEINAKGITEYAQASEKKPRKKREVKKDATKITLIKRLADFMQEIATDVEVTNDQRTIEFVVMGENYSITLTKHRKKKGE
jgi:hypothetical protein